MNHKHKLQFKAALTKARGDKKEIYRILKVGETLGLEWGSRSMYGGGTAVEIYDNVDEVAHICFWDGKHKLDFNEEYFAADFKPSRIEYYSEETLAEIRNEEALYSYEMPHYRIVKGA